MSQQTLDVVREYLKHEEFRLKTFAMDPPWPKEFIDVKQLAKAGFYYTFQEDYVQCAFCMGAVCRWERGDDPFYEHSINFRTCPFIMGGDVGNVPLGQDPFPGPKRPRPYDVCGFNDNNTHSNHIVNEEEIHADNQSQVNNFNPNNSNRCNESLQSSNESGRSSSDLNGICKVCYSNDIQLIFLPCAHSVSCLSCAQQLRNCPVCRTDIATRIRTYLV